MKQNPMIAGILSLLVPGLGQIYVGKGDKGAIMIVAAIIIANLNIVVLPLIAMANPNIQTGVSTPITIWTYWIPRVVHEVTSFWSIAFWCWAIIDAVILARVVRNS